MRSSIQTISAETTQFVDLGLGVLSDLHSLMALLNTVERLLEKHDEHDERVLLRLVGIAIDCGNRLQDGACAVGDSRLDWCGLAEDGCSEMGAVCAAVERLSRDETVKVLAGMGKATAQDLDNEVDLLLKSMRHTESVAA